jgi:hypothetical protein
MNSARVRQAAETAGHGQLIRIAESKANEVGFVQIVQLKRLAPGQLVLHCPKLNVFFDLRVGCL